MPGPYRREPEERFAGDEHLFDLAAVAEGLRREEHPARDGHRQITLVHEGGVTVILFDFEAGGQLPGHSAAGLVMIQVIAGMVDVVADDGTHTLGGGSLLVLAAGVRHDVTAREPSRMLLTVHLQRG
jgi:quercetin dioxygenase-like cupin family protein